MAVIRIDDELQKKIIRLIEGDKRFDYPSVKNFIDKAVIKLLNEVTDEKK